jgi:hypothetical protein
MNDKCGLINENNPCRCALKTKALIKAGMVDPDHLRFNKRSARKVKDVISNKEQLIDNALEVRMQDLFREQKMLSAPDLKNTITTILQRKSVSDIINFN